MSWDSKLKTIVLCDLISAGLIIIFTMIIIILYFISDYSYLKSITTNWNINLIFPLENEKCNTTSSIKIGEWPGTTYACDCSTDPFSFYQIYRRRCKLSLHEATACKNIESKNPVDFKVWKNMSICSSNNQKMNYFSLSDSTNKDYIISKSSLSCPNNKKNCGIVDSMGNVLCVSIDKPCPLNFMKFFYKDLPVPNDLKNDTILNADGGYFILSNKYTNKKLLIDYKISDDLPCASPYYSNSKTLFYMLELNYGNDKCRKQIGIDFIDDRYELIDSSNYRDVTIQNSVLGILLNLPLYPQEILTKPTNLYARNYIGISTTCFDELYKNNKINDFYEEVSSLGNDVNYIFGILTAGLIIIDIYALLNIVADFIILARKKFDSKNFICGIISLSFFIPSLVLYLIAISHFSKNNVKDVITSPNCVDKLTYNASINYFSKTDACKVLTIMVIICLIISCTSNVLQMYLKRRFTSIEDSQEKIMQDL